MREKIKEIISDQFYGPKDLEWMADQIHALYLSEGYVKVESGLVVEEKCPGDHIYKHDVYHACPLCNDKFIISRPATGEEIVEIAEDYWTRPDAMPYLTLKSGARVRLEKKP